MDARCLDTVTLGEMEMPVYFAETALEADAVVVVNRVKAHTNYSGRFESGLTKMTVVGLGRQAGANTFHSTAIEKGYVETLSAALEVILDSAPVVGGVALVENFHEETGTSKPSRQSHPPIWSQNCWNVPSGKWQRSQSTTSTCWPSTNSVRKSPGQGWIRTSSAGTAF